MIGTVVDNKNLELLRMLFQLRQHIDVQRIMALNRPKLVGEHLGHSLTDYLQMSAQELTAIYLCKIFEPATKYNLNSIPGIIKALPHAPLSADQKKAFGTFGKAYGHRSDPVAAKRFLDETFMAFTNTHARSLSRLKEYRDTIGAHSDSDAKRGSLPSHAEFESLFKFASDFYNLVCRHLIGAGPAPIECRVRTAMESLFKRLGLENAKVDFG